MEDEEKIELGSDRDKIQSILNTAPKKRKYYFEQIENAQISEGYTDISIINHIAEVAPDDPDANWLARKRGGIWSFKFEERFQTPPLKIETPPQNMNIIEMLEWLSETDIGESQGQIVISLRLDDLAPVIRDLLRFSFFFEYIEEDYKLGGPIIFSLRCRRWGNLGRLELAKRNFVTYLILSPIPNPTGDELSVAKMYGDFALFKYGKQKYRGNAMRMFFKDLRNDPIWQCIDISDLIYSYSDLPSQTTSKFYSQNIRTLLIEGFTDIELRRLCYDDPDFSPVYEQLSQAMGKDQIIDKLIEYAERRELIERLLALTKDLNPKKYEKHQPYVNNLC